jgi:DNA-binding GntR family transcriptional regulator
MGDTSIVYASKSDLAYEQVRAMILSGELAPGTSLAQKQLAESIGMSVTPMREALKRLMTEGLVELASYKDARVTSVTAEEVRDFLEVRLSLDPLAVFLAAQRHTEDDARRIRLAAADLRPVNRHEGEAALTAHRDFHAALYSASHNTRLVQMLSELWDHSDRYRRLGLALPEAGTSRRRDYEEHLRLSQLVLDRDAEGARSVMIDHVNLSIIGDVAEVFGGRETVAAHGDAE